VAVGAVEIAKLVDEVAGGRPVDDAGALMKSPFSCECEEILESREAAAPETTGFDAFTKFDDELSASDKGFDGGATDTLDAEYWSVADVTTIGESS
jgi:hypothetical protein